MSESHKTCYKSYFTTKWKEKQMAKRKLKILNLDTVFMKIKQIFLKILSKISTLMHLFYFYIKKMICYNQLWFSLNSHFYWLTYITAIKFFFYCITDKTIHNIIYFVLNIIYSFKFYLNILFLNIYLVLKSASINLQLNAIHNLLNSTQNLIKCAYIYIYIYIHILYCQKYWVAPF